MRKEIKRKLEEVNKKIQRHPRDYALIILKNALVNDLKGNKEEALKFYCRWHKRTKDEFVQQRIDALSPLKLVSETKSTSRRMEEPKLERLLNTAEHNILNDITVCLEKHKRPSLLTQAALMKSGHSQKKVRKVIDRLQDQGYITKFGRRYREIKVLDHPVQSQGNVGVPVKESIRQAETSSKKLIFSLKDKKIYVPGSRPLEEDPIEDSELSSADERQVRYKKKV